VSRYRPRGRPRGPVGDRVVEVRPGQFVFKHADWRAQLRALVVSDRLRKARVSISRILGKAFAPDPRDIWWAPETAINLPALDCEDFVRLFALAVAPLPVRVAFSKTGHGKWHTWLDVQISGRWHKLDWSAFRETMDKLGRIPSKYRVAFRVTFHTLGLLRDHGLDVPDLAELESLALGLPPELGISLRIDWKKVRRVIAAVAALPQTHKKELRRTFRALRFLRDVGVPVPGPLALLEELTLGPMGTDDDNDTEKNGLDS